MHCTLDLELTPEITHQKKSALTALLAKASIANKAEPLAQLRAYQSGINEKISVAAVAAKADGLPDLTGTWVIAAPVHLVLQRDDFSLYPEVPIKLSHAESEAYQATLNQHFQSDHLAFYTGRSGQWYLHVNGQGKFSHFSGLTHPSHAIGQTVDAFMPKHVDAKQWLQVQNEIQMLLFDSVENQAREQVGQLPVNSVWLYGAREVAGGDEKTAALHYLSDAPFYQGLASHTQAACEALPSEAANFENIIGESSVSAMIVDLTQATDLDAWLTTCQRLLKRRQLKSLTLQLGRPESTLVAKIRPIDNWRFWRKSHAVSYYK